MEKIPQNLEKRVEILEKNVQILSSAIYILTSKDEDRQIELYEQFKKQVDYYYDDVGDICDELYKIINIHTNKEFVQKKLQEE